MTNQTSHKSVEGKGPFFQIPQVGDIVTAFGRSAVITRDFQTEPRKVFDSGNKIPFEVVFTDNGNSTSTGMPFRSEIVVISKRNDNWNDATVAEINAKSIAQAAFEI